MNLYIIGNGFDIAHNLNTGYINFRTYIESQDWEFLTTFENPYGILPESNLEWVQEYLWKDFENNLSSINETEIIEFGSNIDLGLEGGDIAIEETLDYYWENQYGYIKKLSDFLNSWIEKIDINVPQKTDFIEEDSDDLFITFNYTLLLEELYKVDRYNVLHIHGSIEKNDISPVIGHGNQEKLKNSRKKAREASENFLEKDSSIYNALSNYYERTLKDVEFHIFSNKSFFDRLRSVDEIFIIGHSLGDVDLPYFREVFKKVSNNTIWNVYYYQLNDKNTFIEKIHSIGVSRDKIKTHHTSVFFNK